MYGADLFVWLLFTLQIIPTLESLIAERYVAKGPPSRSYLSRLAF